jgi:hypothetical protein
MVAHRHPHVGVDGVGAGDRLVGVVGEQRAEAVLELEPAGRGDPHLDTHQAAHHGERAGHVVAVADVGQHAALQRAERLVQRHQVGQRLAGVMPRREHVHHRHAGEASQLLEALVGAGAQPDRGHVAGEHQRGVADRLAAGELHLVRAQEQRVAAELDDAGLERDPGAGGGLLEQQRDGAPGERPGGERVGLELDGAVEQPLDLGAGELGTADDVTGQAAQCTVRPPCGC